MKELEELINCIEDLGYTMPLDINAFFNKSKRNKADNDNKMRESIIYNLLNRKINPHSKRWIKINTKLNEFINEKMDKILHILDKNTE